IDLGVPQLIARVGPSRPEEIVAGVGGDAEVLGAFLGVLVDMGILVPSADRGGWDLDPEFAPVDVAVAGVEARREIRDRLRQLVPMALRKGRFGKWMDSTEAQDSIWRAAIRLMSIKHQRTFPALLELAAGLGLDGSRRLLDVGAGSGHHAA